MKTVFKFYLVENNEIVILDYDNLSNGTINLLDNFVNECKCKRTENIITGYSCDMIDLLVAITKEHHILL